MVVRGAGTKLDWGMPPRRLDLIIDTHRLTGVVEHAAGDLITVVRAGTPLADLGPAPASSSRWTRRCPAPPSAARSRPTPAGRGAMLYGTARDLLIGITVVRPDGTVARAGGKVVKNVAGYDLGKLFTGSYGTLGADHRVRVPPAPAPAGARGRPRAAPAADAGALVAAVLAAQVVPAAVEIDAPATGPVELAVLVEGTAAGVRDRAARLREAARRRGHRRAARRGGACYPWDGRRIGMKLTVPLSRCRELLACGAAVRGSAGTGVLYAGRAADIDRAWRRLRAAAASAPAGTRSC